MKMATYGYSVGNDINSTKHMLPSVLEKIHLTPSRPKVIIVGTKVSIFEWMEHYGKLACEFEQEFLSMQDPKPTKADPTIITFKLYYEKDNNQNNIFKRLLSPGSSPKMRMEINALDNNEPSPSSTTTPVMESNGYNGVRLYQVLDKWKKQISNLEQRACDYE